MDDFSIESLYEMGLGFKAANNSSKVSVEDWDGDRDALAYEMASAESMLDTMDVFGKITHLNAIQQIKCAHRISANYGNCNRGIESYCRNVIQSAEDNDAAAGADTNTTNTDKKEDAAKDEKKDAWYKKVFKIIKKFFEKIWQFICSIPRRIKAFIKRIFGKKENNSSSSNNKQNQLALSDKSSKLSDKQLATYGQNSQVSNSSSSNNKQNQLALSDKSSKLSDKQLATYGQNSQVSNSSSSDGQLKNANDHQTQNNNSNTNSKLSENTLKIKKNFEEYINVASENIEQTIKDIEGSHNKLLSIIDKIEKSKTQDKKALSIFSNCCKIISESYKTFVKGSNIFSSFCSDFLNSINDETHNDKNKMNAFNGAKTAAKNHGKQLKIIIVQTCMIGENIKFSEFKDSKIKEEIHNGSAVTDDIDYHNRPIINSASSFVKAVTNYVQVTFDYNLTDTIAKDGLNNELLKKNPDGFFRKLLSSIQKLKTNAKEMNTYMNIVYGVDIGEENIKKYLGGN